MKIIKELEEFELSTNEAKIYLASLKLGPSSVQKIAARATMNRVTAYGIAEALIKKGFLYEVLKSKRRQIAPYPPMKLYDVLSRRQEQLRRQEHHLEKLIPLLKSVDAENTTETKVKYYEGNEGMKNWASDSLTSKGEVLEWTTKIELFAERFNDYLDAYYFPMKTKLQIPSRFIFLDTPENRMFIKKRYFDPPDAPPVKVRFLDEKSLDNSGFVVIYNDCLSIAVLDQLRAVSVNDPLIANAQRKIFEFGWLNAKDELQNKEYPFHTP